jgi:hypothetical protein
MSPENVAFLRASVTRWVSDEPFPGLVEVELRDGKGKGWSFVDKYPMFLQKGILSPSSQYPVSINIACTVLRRSPEEIVVSTAEPWGLEAADGTYEFVMDPSQVLDPRDATDGSLADGAGEP